MFFIATKIYINQTSEFVEDTPHAPASRLVMISDLSVTSPPVITLLPVCSITSFVTLGISPGKISIKSTHFSSLFFEILLNASESITKNLSIVKRPFAFANFKSDTFVDMIPSSEVLFSR